MGIIAHPASFDSQLNPASQDRKPKLGIMAYPASSEHTASSSFTRYTAFSIFTGSITQVGNQSLSYFTGYQASSLSGFTGSFPKHEFKISHIMSTSFIEETSHTRINLNNRQLELKVQIIKNYGKDYYY